MKRLISNIFLAFFSLILKLIHPSSELPNTDCKFLEDPCLFTYNPSEPCVPGIEKYIKYSTTEICVEGTWEGIIDVSYSDCVQIKIMMPTAVSGYFAYTVGSIPFSASRVFHCIFSADKSWTQIHETRNKDMGNNGEENFSDNDLHYTRIYFHNRGQHQYDFVEEINNSYPLNYHILSS